MALFDSLKLSNSAMSPIRFVSILIVAIFAFASATSSRAQWVQTGGPPGGSVYCFLEYDSMIYAGTSEGVIRSEDNGQTWAQTSKGLVTKVLSLVSKDSFIIAGTNRGIYRSSDGGNNWILASAPDTSVDALIRTNKNLVAGALNGGLYVSTNVGGQWITSVSGLPIPKIRSLWTNGATLLAGAARPDPGGGSIYQSEDEGFSWHIASTGLSAISDVMAIAGKDSFVYIGTGSDGVFRSKVETIEWTPIDSGLSPNAEVFAMLIRGSSLFIGTVNGMYKSTNDGTSWTPLDSGMLVFPTALLARDSNLFEACWWAGMFLSTNEGSSWTPVKTGLRNSVSGPLLVFNGFLFAGTEECGLFRTSDLGNSWTPMSLGPRTHIDAIALFDSTVYVCPWLYARLDRGGIFYSSDSGNTWRDAGLDTVLAYNVLWGHQNIFVSWKDGILRSSDTGKNWQYVNNGLEDSTTAFGVVPIVCLLRDGSNIFAAGAGTSNGGVFRSSDEGDHWTRLDNGLFGHQFMALGKIGKYLLVSGASGFFRSSDNGDSWQRTTNGIADSLYGVRSFILSDSNIFANVNGGVYLSTDQGVTLKNVGIDMPSVLNGDINFLAVCDDYLFAATGHNGVWRRPLSEMIGQSAVTKTEATYQSLRCYPNPLSQSTTISFSPETGGHADISIVNQLGVEMARIFSGELDAGEHSFTWDARGVGPKDDRSSARPNGVYECVIRMNGRVDKLPMLLLQ
jgi:hypothetical protein